ncbi:MAG: DNA helicase RecQ [Minisyncoccales bacterium]
MKNNPHKILENYFGYESFREGQEEIINNILKDKNTLGVMPTGSGKSICFQIPALCRKGVTIVISPLISLMKDQADSLKSLNINADFINSSLSRREIVERIIKTKRGEYDILYVAPERLRSNRFIKGLKKVNITSIAVDEAHCISTWGHDFRPSYRLIPNLISKADNPTVSAFTATATKEVREDIINLLGVPSENAVITGFDRPNLNFKVVKEPDKRDFIIQYLKLNKKDSGIIYAATRREVESLANYLNEEGFSATPYHAGIPKEQRKEAQEDFVYDKVKTIVATSAFGMGIDKSNVRYVIHHNMPKNLEEYYQQAGRAGRDGLESDCILLFSPSDTRLPRYFIEKADAPPEIKKLKFKKLQQIIDYCHTPSCLRSYILDYFDANNNIKNCNHCSNCNNKKKIIDITEEAQKIISCVYKMNESHGINMVAWVLKGSKRKKVLENNFNKLSTYGIMKDLKIKKIKNLINFLIAEKYLELEGGKYPTVSWTNKSKPILKGEGKVKRRIIPQEITKVRDSDKLFEKLRKLRTKIAREEGYPPYIIFNDDTLQEMIEKGPKNKKEMLKIKGVGSVKFKKYGEQFLKKIKKHLN